MSLRNFSNDKETVKESQICGHIVKYGKETYQRNTFGHGLIILKLSIIEQKLQNMNAAMELKKNAEEILTNCIGKEQTIYVCLKNIIIASQAK